MQNSILARTFARRPKARPIADDLLDLSLFGTLGMRQRGQTLDLELPPHAVRLLAYLLLNRERVVPRPEAAAALWPADNEADARANLRHALQTLTRKLPESSEPWIVTTAARVAWNAGAPYRLDIDEFERLCAKSERDAADASYADHLMVALDDDWVVRERDRLRTLAIENLLAMLAGHQQRREFAAAMRCAQRLTGLDPSRKDAVGALITLRRDSAEPLTPPNDGAAHGEPTTRPLADPGPSHVPAAGEMPFVGRSRETDLLRNAWIDAANGNGSAHVVLGAAGIGKTRLLDDFAAFVTANGGRIFRAAATAPESAPYAAVSEALRCAVPALREIAIDSATLATLATIVPQLHAAVGEPAPIVPLEPEPDRTRLVAAVASALAALAAVHPSVLIIEDIEWAGSATIVLLERIARHAPEQRLLVVISYSEGTIARTHPLRAFRTRLERERLLHPIELAPLEPAAVADLVARVTDAPSAERAAILHARSGGNPFALEQIMADDREAGRMRPAQGHAARPAVPSQRADDAAEAAVRARLERLSPAGRSVGETAALFGRALTLVDLLPASDLDEDAARAGMRELIAGGILRLRDDRSDAYVVHARIARAFDERLAIPARRELHLRIGYAREAAAGDAREDFAGELAMHFDRGGEAERAADHYRAAAERALAFHSADEARALAGRACELTRDPATRFRATAVIEEAAGRQADRAAQRDAAARLRALAGEIDDPRLRREALRRMIAVFHERSEPAAERAALDELEPLVRGAGPFWETAYARLRAAFLAAAGSAREARATLVGALATISRERDPLPHAQCWCALIDLAAGDGHMEDVRAFLDAAPMFEAMYGRATAPLLLKTACVAAGRIRDYAALVTSAERLRRCALEIGDSEGAAAADAYAGRAARRLFRVDAALSALGRASALFASIGQPVKALQIQSEIGSLRATVGRYDDAIDIFAAAAARAAAISFRFGQVACLNGISYTASLRGDLTRARATALEALGIADSIGSRSGRAHALVSIGVAQREAGELDASIEHLEAGTSIERELNEWSALGMDLCELIVALVRHRRIERAMQLADEVLALADNPTLHFSLPHVLLVTVAAVRYANGDRARASALLAQARRALDEITATIEDAPTRATFRALGFNRAIDDAFERDVWRL
jgi:tetratricopeptide (TPR) repeat protein